MPSLVLLAVLGLGGCAGGPEPSDQQKAPFAADPSAAGDGQPLPLDPVRAALQDQVLAIESEMMDQPRPLAAPEVATLLGYYCKGCHFLPAGNTENISGLFYIDDLDKLMATGKVLPGDGEGSRLVQRMRRGEMPPQASRYPPMPDADIDGIVAYIDGLPAPLPPAAPPPPQELPWVEEAQQRPEVPPVQAPCFEFLGHWLRCEGEGESPEVVSIPGKDLEACFAACRQRSDCVAVTDYSWLNAPLAADCYLNLSSCNAPAEGVWHEEDAGREYRKVCSTE